MGFYINPVGCPKEQWLQENATEISPDEALPALQTGLLFPICLVDNGPFTAAGIAFDEDELKAFQHPDSGLIQRPRKWYTLTREEAFKINPSLKSYFEKLEAYKSSR